MRLGQVSAMKGADSGQPVAQRKRRRRRARLDAELSEDAGHMVADGGVADAEYGGDLGVGVTLDKQAEDLTLAGR